MGASFSLIANAGGSGYYNFNSCSGDSATGGAGGGLYPGVSLGGGSTSVGPSSAAGINAPTTPAYSGGGGGASTAAVAANSKNGGSGAGGFVIVEW